MIVSTKSGVTLVGGGALNPATLRACLARAPFLVAADGGAAACLAQGAVPRATIGDMDSLDAASRAGLPAGSIHRIAEQDSTDFAKALRNIDAGFILCAGFLGARMDHAMAAMTQLVRHDGPPAVLVGCHDLAVHVAGPMAFDLPAGARVSLFPMAPVTGRSTGLVWPIDGFRMAPTGAIGTSNRATGGRVTLTMDAPGMVLLLDPAHLDPVLAGFSA
jgi:thiamine pyrophosphokinase